MPLLSTIRLTQIERGIAVDRTSRASLLNALREVRHRRVEPHPRQQRRDEEDDVRLVADRALEDLREDEPVDRAHHERIEHRPQVAQRARGIAHPQVARRQQPQRMQVAPGRSGGADGGCGHGVESRSARLAGSSSCAAWRRLRARTRRRWCGLPSVRNSASHVPSALRTCAPWVEEMPARPPPQARDSAQSARPLQKAGSQVASGQSASARTISCPRPSASFFRVRGYGRRSAHRPDRCARRHRTQR